MWNPQFNMRNYIQSVQCAIHDDVIKSTFFRNTNHLCGKFTGHRWIPCTKASFDVFFDLRLNKRLSKQSWGWWFETPSRALWHISEQIIMIIGAYWPLFYYIHLIFSSIIVSYYPNVIKIIISSTRNELHSLTGYDIFPIKRLSLKLHAVSTQRKAQSIMTHYQHQRYNGPIMRNSISQLRRLCGGWSQHQWEIKECLQLWNGDGASPCVSLYSNIFNNTVVVIFHLLSGPHEHRINQWDNTLHVPT